MREVTGLPSRHLLYEGLFLQLMGCFADATVMSLPWCLEVLGEGMWIPAVLQRW